MSHTRQHHAALLFAIWRKELDGLKLEISVDTHTERELRVVPVAEHSEHRERLSKETGRQRERSAAMGSAMGSCVAAGELMLVREAGSSRTHI